MCKKYDAQRVDNACGLALEHDLVRYGFIKSYLERTTPRAQQLDLLQSHPIIRQLGRYQELFTQLVQQEMS